VRLIDARIISVEILVDANGVNCSLFVALYLGFDAESVQAVVKRPERIGLPNEGKFFHLIVIN